MPHQEARLQVELARLKYLAPRTRVRAKSEGWGRGGKRGQRVLSRDRAPESAGPHSELQRELKAVHREQVERRRHREGLPKVAIVGYTTPESLQLCGRSP